jgi:TP901 family phage tail tape measure protein
VAIQADILDVILRIQNLRRFQAGMRTAAREVRGVGVASKQAAAGQAKLAGSTRAMLLAGRAARWGAAGLVLMAAEGYKLSVNFEAQMTRVQTMAGASAAEVSGLRQSILDLAPTTGQGPQELAAALYHLESVGLRGAKALDAVKAAADGAAMGGADLEDTASALGGVLRTHMKGAADDARGAIAQLSAIAGAGNMTMQNLVHGLGTGILPAAKAAGVSLTNVGAAIALLTDENYPASSAAAQLGTALHFLYAPTNKAKDALADLGLTQGDLVSAMNSKDGLMGALKLLEGRLQSFSGGDRAKYLEELGNILPGGRGRVLILLMNQLDNYQRKIHQIEGTSGQFEEHLKKTHQTAKFRLHAAWAGLQKDLIELADTYKGPATSALVVGLGVLSVLANVLAGIPGAIDDMKDAWDGLPGPLKVVIELVAILTGEFLAWRVAMILWSAATAIAALVMGGLETAILGVMIAMDFLMANPYVAIIALLIAVLILAITHWKWFKNAALDAWHWIKHAAGDVAHSVSSHWHKTLTWLKNAWHNTKRWIIGAAHSVVNWFKNHWQTLVMIIGGPFGVVVVQIIKHWKDIKRGARNAAHFVAHIWHEAFNKIKHAASDTKDFLLHYTPMGITNRAMKMLHLPHFAQGGVSLGGMSVVGERGPELVNLPQGASVIPTGQSYFEPRRHTPNPSPSSARPEREREEHIHLHIDGREVTKVVNRRNADRKARK